MNYHAVKNRCAVDMSTLDVPLSKEEVLNILWKKGFKIVDTDIIKCAYGCVGKSIYRRGAHINEAPHVVDCSSFIKWLYGMRGIWLPRRSIQQRELGESVSFDAIDQGDVVFVSGWIDYYITDPKDGVGHVGIATGKGTVIHAAGKRLGIVETPLECFVYMNKFRGARRYVPKNEEIITFECPEARSVEMADDIKWIVLQSLSTK